VPHDYAIGDVVIYQTFGGGRRHVLVTETFNENGDRGFSGHLLNPQHERKGCDVWGYDDQIEAVERYMPLDFMVTPDPDALYDAAREDAADAELMRAYERDREHGTRQDDCYPEADFD
jgi:hypothetical protein